MGVHRLWRWLLGVAVAAAAVVAVVVLTGSGAESGEAQPAATTAPNVVQAGAPGEPSRTLSQDELTEIETPKHSREDVEFVQGMLHHHAQALEMTAYVPDRSAGRELPLFAKRVDVSQQGEIELMETWLKERGEQPPEHAHGHELMPGMLTAAELATLEAAEGREFNRLFLRSMIRHHQGALTMVGRLREANAGQEPELDNLIRHIEADQTIEIGRMRRLLARLRA